MIPLGPTDIGRYARVVADCDNGRSGPPGRSVEPTRWFSAGDVVRILDWRTPASWAGTPGPGFARVTIGLDGVPNTILTTSANNLELVDPPTYLRREPAALADSAGPHVVTDVQAQRLSLAHADVAEAYKTLSYALNTLKAIEKETAR